MMTRCVRFAVLGMVGTGFAWASAVFAVPPPNDNCSNAISIREVANIPFSTEGATFDGPGGCMTSPNIWYRYTASCTGPVTVSLCGSNYDTKLAVYSGSCGSFGAPLFCNDNFCGLQSRGTFTAIAGNTYLVEVGGAGSATGLGVLSVCCGPPPSNDNCANATPIGEVTDLPYSTLCASFDGPGGCITSPNVWFRYTASCDKAVSVSLCGSDFDTFLGVFDGGGCNPVGPPVLCQDDYCGLSSHGTFRAQGGHTYLIEIGGYVGTTGTGTLTISCCVPRGDVAGMAVTNCPDGVVGIVDVIAVINKVVWGIPYCGPVIAGDVGGAPDTNCPDGVVNIADILTLIKYSVFAIPLCEECL